MDVKSTIIYGQLFEHKRTEEEKQFLAELFLKMDGNLGMIAKFIPDSITPESMFRSFEVLHQHVFGEYHHVSSGKVDEVTAGLVIPQVKLMTLLPKTRHDLFMLLAELVFHFGSYPSEGSEQLGESVINMAYGAMVGILKGNHWHDWKIKLNDDVKKTEVNISDGFTMEEQMGIITMLDCMRNVKDEGARRNIAYLLVEKKIITDEAIATYRDQLEERYIREPGPLMKDTDRVIKDKTLNALMLAQVGKIGAVKFFDAYLTKKK